MKIAKNKIMRFSKKVLIHQTNTNNKTINRVQTMLSNYMELQNNIFNNYQAIFSKLIDDTSKSYWNNFIIGERYTDAYKMHYNKKLILQKM
jgi:hypothetical protein